jgi:hypothetical protein
MTALNFLFRKPRLPIIIDTGAGLLGVKSWTTCEKRLATVMFPDMAPRDVIDSTAEAFSLISSAIVCLFIEKGNIVIGRVDMDHSCCFIPQTLVSKFSSTSHPFAAHSARTRP